MMIIGQIFQFISQFFYNLISFQFYVFSLYYLFHKNIISNNVISKLNDIFQDEVQYRQKIQPRKVCMMDGAQKTVMVDESKTVADNMIVICAKIGNL